MFPDEEEYLTEEIKELLDKEYKRIDEAFNKKIEAVEKILKYCISKLEDDRDDEKRCAYNDILLASYIEIEGEKSSKKYANNNSGNCETPIRKITEMF